MLGLAGRVSVSMLAARECGKERTLGVHEHLGGLICFLPISDNEDCPKPYKNVRFWVVKNNDENLCHLASLILSSMDLGKLFGSCYMLGNLGNLYWPAV
jgi:hypothetical protein